MKDSKYYKKKYGSSNTSNKTWLSKLLISIIIVLSSLIVTNLDTDIKKYFKNKILNDNMKFNDVRKIYNEVVGTNKKDNTQLVSNVIIDSEYQDIGGSYRIENSGNEGVVLRNGGIIVFIGEKDNLGNTVIVQGNDGVDIWYSNIEVTEYGLYDYVSKGNILGNSFNDYYVLTIVRDGEKLKYDEYF